MRLLKPSERVVYSGKTLEVTRQVYRHAIPEEQRSAVEKVEKLLIWTPMDPSFRSRAEAKLVAD
jgi:hypothetical protein